MIVRILGEGQLEVPDAAVSGLNHLDEELVEAVEADDHSRYRQILQELLAAVRAAANPTPPDLLAPSDLVLPGPDASIEEVRGLLHEEGLIPD